MNEISISEFNANCVAILKNVHRTKRPVRITRSGKPIADVVPAAAPRHPKRNWLGSMAGTAEIVGDIISPVLNLPKAPRRGSDRRRANNR